MAVIWFIIGVCLIVAELFLPGGVALFLGMSALLVGLTVLTGLVGSWQGAFLTWMILTALLFLILHKSLRQWLGAERSYKYQGEDAESYERIVEVQDTIPLGEDGRINFQGSTWTARNHRQDRELPKGAKVRLLYRDGLVWMVEPVDDDEKEVLEQGPEK